jgi:hypothetical protein
MTSRLGDGNSHFCSALDPATYIPNHVMGISGDEVADVVLKKFEELPKKGKPLNRQGGVKEWVPLSGIVAQG